MNSFLERTKNFLILCGLVCVFSGCAITPSTPENVTVWQGRFSIQITVDKKTDRNSGTFMYTGGPGKNFSLSLYGPLGVTAAKLSEDENGASLERPSEKTVKAGNVETLTSIALGIPIPIQKLSAWLEGNPIPNESFVRQGSSFIQGGWLVTPEKDGSGKIRKLEIQNAEAVPAEAIKLILLLR